MLATTIKGLIIEYYDSGFSVEEITKRLNVNTEIIDGFLCFTETYKENKIQQGIDIIDKIVQLKKIDNFTDIKDVKQLTVKKREFLGLPTDFNSYDVGSGLDFVRELARSRDNRTCQHCNRKWTKGERKLDVHHLDEVNGKSAGSIRSIKYDKENLHRLITLCHKCHCLLHTELRRLKKLQKYTNLYASKKDFVA